MLYRIGLHIGETGKAKSTQYEVQVSVMESAGGEFMTRVLSVVDVCTVFLLR